MNKLLTLTLISLLPILAIAESPSDQLITGDTNYTLTITATNNVIIPKRNYRVVLQVISQTNTPICVSLGNTTKSKSPILTSTGQAYSITPPIVYTGPVALKTTTNTATVLVYEAWRDTP